MSTSTFTKLMMASATIATLVSNANAAAAAADVSVASPAGAAAPAAPAPGDGIKETKNIDVTKTDEVTGVTKDKLEFCMFRTEIVPDTVAEPAAEVADPKAEDPKAEDPKAEDPKAEVPKVEAPKDAVPKDDVPAARRRALLSEKEIVTAEEPGKVTAEAKPKAEEEIATDQLSMDTCIANLDARRVGPFMKATCSAEDEVTFEYYTDATCDKKTLVQTSENAGDEKFKNGDDLTLMNNFVLSKMKIFVNCKPTCKSNPTTTATKEHSGSNSKSANAIGVLFAGVLVFLGMH